jgi:hypothetical protein
MNDASFYARSQNCEKRLLASSCLSVCPSVRLSFRRSAGNNSASTGRIFLKTLCLSVFPKSEFKCHYNPTRITSTLHEDQYTSMMLPRWILLRTRNISDNSCRESQNTHFTFSNFFLYGITLFVRKCGKILQSRTGHRWQYGACALQAGYLNLLSWTLQVSV